tara:strand:- start:45 stop:149 length:105 start_codon:yes stop_codon:yes gene_type:complete
MDKKKGNVDKSPKKKDRRWKLKQKYLKKGGLVKK